MTQEFFPTVTDPFPNIRTHRYNTASGRMPVDKISDIKLEFKKSLFMVGRQKEKEMLKSILNFVYKKNGNELVLIRGVLGSGKSLFVRKCLYEFVTGYKEINQNYL